VQDNCQWGVRRSLPDLGHLVGVGSVRHHHGSGCRRLRQDRPVFGEHGVTLSLHVTRARSAGSAR
jgi:hypothetical protein